MKGTKQQANIIKQFIEKEKVETAEREEDRRNFRIPYEKWSGYKDHPDGYKDYKKDLFKKLGWTTDWVKFWD